MRPCGLWSAGKRRLFVRPCPEPAGDVQVVTGCVVWLVVLSKEPPDQFTAAAHPDFLEDRLEVILHRIGRDVEGVGHLGCRQPTQHALHDLTLAPGEILGLHDQWGDLDRLGHLQSHRSLSLRARI